MQHVLRILIRTAIVNKMATPATQLIPMENAMVIGLLDPLSSVVITGVVVLDSNVLYTSIIREPSVVEVEECRTDRGVVLGKNEVQYSDEVSGDESGWEGKTVVVFCVDDGLGRERETEVVCCVDDGLKWEEKNVFVFCVDDGLGGVSKNIVPVFVGDG